MKWFKNLFKKRNVKLGFTLVTAGEEMGLGKPWEPDWDDDLEKKYILYMMNNTITKHVCGFIHAILAFPTPEMRDAFYKNFKPEIESCKELL